MRLLLLLLCACVGQAPPDDVRPPDSDHDGVADTDDCQPLDASRSPRAGERCNGVDDDCDWLVDEDLPLHDGFDDSDGDGFGDPDAPVQTCGGGVRNNADCDPGDPAVHPDATERCDDVDSDCDGDLEDGPVRDQLAWFEDRDGDGFGDPDRVRFACLQPDGYTLDNLDCDDERAEVSPAAAEVCDASDLDEDCDGRADSADDWQANGIALYRDADRDGFGDGDRLSWGCTAVPGWATSWTDCRDGDPGSYPGADERCDHTDNDCDGEIDERPVDPPTWYRDLDADGYGDDAHAITMCFPPLPFVREGGDCDEARDDVHPGAADVCADPTDYNCDGSVGTIDADGDGWAACDECDDTDATVSPGADERCDGIDNDCDGSVDDAGSVDAVVWYADSDHDGHGDASASERACVQPRGHVPTADDCDDTDVWRHPGQRDTCDDAGDWDCDGAEC